MNRALFELSMSLTKLSTRLVNNTMINLYTLSSVNSIMLINTRLSVGLQKRQKATTPLYDAEESTLLQLYHEDLEDDNHYKSDELFLERDLCLLSYVPLRVKGISSFQTKDYVANRSSHFLFIPAVKDAVLVW